MVIVQLIKITPIMVFCLIVSNSYVSASTETGFNKEPVYPIPDIKINNPAEVKLGRKLFHDVRLSANNTFSCASCHLLANMGVDSLPVAIGINGLKGVRNTPTVYNSSLSFRQFWDGRVKTLEEQARGPINNPVEMASNWQEVLTKLGKDPWYQQQFRIIYPAGLTAANITKAIAVFERTLLTPDSPFDQYLKGDNSAINAETREGYYLFKSYGCASCHQGVLLGGNMYEKLGVVKKYYTSERNDSDYGRFEQSGINEHKHEFKVPGLRNVALTAPYLHNGSVPTLEDAIIIMGKYQLGRHIPEQDVKKIILFLKSLTGKIKP
ncbi:MAG: cytochrome-c peroxidase [gamma proteobacterium symbiont of Taylorina sp.]|nr:cytochrome-c peroxidase [gamma proteobacterium symbiont of Taylorina sp.]